MVRMVNYRLFMVLCKRWETGFVTVPPVVWFPATFTADGCGGVRVEVGGGPEVRGGDVKERAEERGLGGAQLESEDKVSRPPQQNVLRRVLA